MFSWDDLTRFVISCLRTLSSMVTARIELGSLERRGVQGARSRHAIQNPLVLQFKIIRGRVPDFYSTVITFHRDALY